jgi:PLP dependent protein
MPSPLTNLKDIQQSIEESANRAQRPATSIKLIAVSKGHEMSQIVPLAKSGILDFGENYVQEWKSKCHQLGTENPDIGAKLHWHFIGHLQTNKAKEVVGKVAYIHTMDSLKLAQRISALAQAMGLTQKVLIEVNLAGETTKHGILPEALLSHLKHFTSLPGLSWEGLMAIPPALHPAEKVRPYFVQLKSLLDECNQTGVFKQPMKELSMGMSQDYKIAIEEGATMVRLGTALFGPRR